MTNQNIYHNMDLFEIILNEREKSEELHKFQLEIIAKAIESPGVKFVYPMKESVTQPKLEYPNNTIAIEDIREAMNKLYSKPRYKIAQSKLRWIANPSK